MHITSAEGLSRLAEANTLFIELFKHGTLSIEIYKPAEKDLQQPHDRDELYVVINGHGTFMSGSKTVQFGPGDVLFVPAGEVHRFETYSEDFCTWVFFYGPVGGESKSL